MAFGPKIVGKAAYAALVKKSVGKAGFGPRVTGKQPGVVGTIPETVPVSVPVTRTDGLSIEQLQTILAESPAFLEALHVQELERSEGPRRTALLVLLATAEATNNTDIFTEIDDLLKDMPAPPPPPPPTAIPTDFAQLKALALTLGVDLKKHRSKVDITAAVKLALDALPPAPPTA